MKTPTINCYLGLALTFILLLLSVNSFAQNSSSSMTQTYVSCYTEDFNLSGKVKRIKISTFDYENGIRASIPQSETIYRFDTKGNCISANSNDYSFSVPTHQTVEYSYDSSGNVLTERFTEDAEFCGRKKYQYNPFKELLYNDENELEEIIATEKKGSYSALGFNGTLIETHSDSKGHVYSKTISYYKDGKKTKGEEYSGGTLSNSTSYTYDSNGHLILSKTSDSSGRITRKEVNTYSDGSLVSTELYLLFSTLDIAKAWRYDAKGRKIYYCCYMVLPDYLIESYSYEEDSHGNWTKQWIKDQNNKIVHLIEREIQYY